MSGGGTRETSPFGFTDMPPPEKTRRVRGVFASVARRYDLMNDLMSGGTHRLWKATLIDLLQPRPEQTLLDVAGGTGDIARRFLAAGGGGAWICDASPPMLAAGRGKKPPAGGTLHYCCAAAERLPFPDACFESYSIAFGLRNLTDIPAALAEACRVLKPLGRFACLEFSPQPLPLLGPVYDRYSFSVLPKLGRLVARDAASYRYLAESIRRFPPPDDLAAMLRAAGLARVRAQGLSGGIVAIHSGWRL